MSDPFDPSAIYNILGCEVTHLPASGGEVIGMAVLDLPGREVFSGDAMVTEPTLRFPSGQFDVRRGDTFVVNGEAWIVGAPARAIYDGAECVAPVSKGIA